MKIRRHFLISKRQILLFLGDFFIIAWFVFVNHSHETAGKYLLCVAVKFFPYFFTYYIFDLYNPLRDYRKGKEIVRVAAVVCAGFLFSSFTLTFLSIMGRRFQLLFFLNALICMVAWRFIFSYICMLKPIIRKCLIAGAGKTGMETLALIRAHPQCGLQVAGFIDDDPGKQGMEIEGGIGVLGDSSKIDDIVEERGIKMIIVAIVEHRSKNLLSRLVEVSEKGVEITTSPDIFGQVADRIPLTHIDIRWVYLVTMNKQGYYRSPLKRGIDVAGALAGILLSIPFYILVPPLIKLTSRGPVFFLQDRLGLNKRVFKTIKFRTMVDGAEKTKTFSTADNDSRITKLGRFLRRKKIDELPQFINVLKGEMSLVGPRPVSVKEAEQNGFDKEIPFWDLRFQMKPGVSGWAQVNYPYGATLREAARRMEYEIFYIKNNSMVIDLFVILKTVKSLFYLKGR
jgi:exopolysaccharide biosynthesis polyprenyl glycosylphosphotransferase